MIDGFAVVFDRKKDLSDLVPFAAGSMIRCNIIGYSSHSKFLFLDFQIPCFRKAALVCETRERVETKVKSNGRLGEPSFSIRKRRSAALSGQT